MGTTETEAEAEATVLKLPLFSPHQHKHISVTSPIHHTLVSVPFQWEKEPGKPNLNNLPINSSNFKPKSLEPPPRLYYSAVNTPSPTTVLDGPYNNNTKYSSSSFRFFKKISRTPETEQFLNKGNWWKRNVKRKGYSSSNNSSIASVILSSEDSDEGRSCSARMASFRRNGSSSDLSATKPHMIWANIYEGFKKAMPWKSSKSKNCSSCNLQHQQTF